MKIYNRRDLNKLASELKFNRDTLEKVLRLAELLKLFNNHDDLKGKYVLKGGTAINLCLSDFPRLSVDIDLNFNLDCTKEEMIEIRGLHKKIISEHVALNGYAVHPKSRFTFTLDSYLLQYSNVVGNSNYIKLELNYSNRIQIETPINYDVNSNVVDNESILGLSKIELYGSKIAALIGRTTARDIFDVYEMINKDIISDSEFNKLRKCSIFYLLTSNEFKPIEELVDKFKNNIANITFNNIKRNLIPMLRLGTKVDVDSLKETVTKYVDKLFKLTQDENGFVSSFNTGKYKPDLLFDIDTAKRLKNHPMALWKVISYKKSTLG